ncbi:MAG: family 1 encapsulin nanocompartment shell protein [Planctomycetota bacterium]
MDLLKRELAPILPAAWAAIDEEARRVLTANLAARKVVDVEGPLGWEFAAVNLGRLDLFKEEPIPEVHVGKRAVQPLIEFRIPIRLPIMELDYVVRGAKDPELEPVRAAALKAAQMEDRAIFHGYSEGGIVGIAEASPHKPLPKPKGGSEILAAALEGAEVLRAAGVEGPYALVLSVPAYAELQAASAPGFPVARRLEEALGTAPVSAPRLEGALLVSARGGDFVLTLGQDLAVGYAHQDKHTVELYLTESFTFRVVEPAAAVRIGP